MALYVYSNANSNLTTFPNGNRQLVETGATAATVSVTVPSAGTQTFGFFTNENVPTPTTSNGVYVIQFNITTGNNQITVTPTIARINSAGVVQTSATTTGQTATAGTKTFSITADLGTFAAGDRFRVSFVASNAQNMTNSFSYTVGSATTDTVDPPFNGPQSLTGTNLVEFENSTNGSISVRASSSNLVEFVSDSEGIVFNANNNASSQNTVQILNTAVAVNLIRASNSNTVSVNTSSVATNPIRASNSNIVSVNTSTVVINPIRASNSNTVNFVNASTFTSEFLYYDYFINLPSNYDGYFINFPNTFQTNYPTIKMDFANNLYSTETAVEGSYEYYVNLRK